MRLTQRIVEAWGDNVRRRVLMVPRHLSNTKNKLMSSKKKGPPKNRVEVENKENRGGKKKILIFFSKPT
jgi:hypothetical protein